MSKLQTSNVGLIHLSDIHFSSKKDPLIKRGESLFRSLKDNFFNCPFVYIVVSGDIANTGKESEYQVALDFFVDLKERLEERYSSTQFKFVYIPGNHDCNFDLNKQARINATKNINYETIGEDDSVLQICLQVQSDFWDFYNLFNDIPDDKLYYRITDTIADKKLCFHCFNTAWMTQENEKPGTLFFPAKHYDKLRRENEFDLNIAVLHHPHNWFNPKGACNNKREFQSLLDDISSLQIIGHEHENEVRKTENIDSAISQTFYVYGDILQNQENPTQSGFQTFFINLYTNKVRLERCRLEQDIYQQYSEKEIVLNQKSSRVVELNSTFIEKLDRISLPLDFGDRHVKLSDIYIFPDLEILASETGDAIDDYVDSEGLADDSHFKNCTFEGDSQIGKSSLLHMLFLKFYDKGFYPILLDGKDITSGHFERVLRKAFESQYTEDSKSYEEFKQINNDLKILLIDNFYTSKQIRTAKYGSTDLLFDVFSRTFITLDSAYSITPEIQTQLKGLCSFSIKPLGYRKQNDLIKKYLALKDPTFADTSQIHLDKIRYTFDQLRQILGDKLIPSYPVFVLSIIQALQHASLDLSGTSYGYCYQALILLGFNNAGISKNSIDSYMNIIAELAFHMFIKKIDSIGEIDFEAFYKEYRETFIGPGFETVRKNLLNSRLLEQDFGSFYFSYKYLLYFLAANKIAERIDESEGKEIVKGLNDSLHEEKNAIILVLVTHHTKNYSFIEESIRILMSRFSSTTPITLKKSCNYYQLIEEVAKEVKQDVIEMNRNPSKEREKQLIAQDKIGRKLTQNNDDRDDSIPDEVVMPFVQAFRSIEIVGQIIRNRKGSLRRETLKRMVVELYDTAFRMLSYFGEMVKQAKNEVSLTIKESISQKDTNQDIENEIYKFLHFISFQACLGVFSKLIHSIGVTELREMYSNIATEIGTPVAKIVSFSINSYHGTMDMEELKKLSKEFEGNIVALQILRARVKAYVYNNYVDYKKKQKIAAYLGMQISPALGRKYRGH